MEKNFETLSVKKIQVEIQNKNVELKSQKIKAISIKNQAN